MHADTVELARSEVIRLLRNAPLSTRDVHSLSLLMETEGETASLLHQLEGDGVVERYTTSDGSRYWRLLRVSDGAKPNKLDEKLRLLERIALIVSDDIADTLLEIRDDLKRM